MAFAGMSWRLADHVLRGDVTGWMVHVFAVVTFLTAALSRAASVLLLVGTVPPVVVAGRRARRRSLDA
jgi:hypothetical protein